MIEGMQAILLFKIIDRGEYEVVGQDAMGKPIVRVTNKLFHNYFSFARAVTLIVDEVTVAMSPVASTDVVNVRRLLWTRIGKNW